ncbi:MAG TPA: hypothetical protein VGX48_27895 [Pyrinomonadaceae bacterium]|jgi:hypothetical protein|nr:hypothetical protein [Pyrinomonadaceae bacterium]
MRVRCGSLTVLLLALLTCAPPPEGASSQATPRAQTGAARPSPSPRAAPETFSVGVMYWATPRPVLCKDWYVVLGGTVVETHREEAPELARQHFAAGTLKVERVFMSLPTEREAAPEGFAYFKSEGFDGLRRGDKVIVFVNEYDGGYGLVEAAGSNSKLGIKVRSWDEPIVEAVAAMTRDAQAAKLPGDRQEALKDPRHAEAWRPFNGRRAVGEGCRQ